jgi:hypothetical protein
VNKDREHQESDAFIDTGMSESKYALPSAFQRATKSIPYGK